MAGPRQAGARTRGRQLASHAGVRAQGLRPAAGSGIGSGTAETRTQRDGDVTVRDFTHYVTMSAPEIIHFVFKKE